VLIGVWIVLAVSMAIADMEPRVVVLGAALAGAATAIWVVVDVGTGTRPMQWYPVVETPFPGHTSDARISTIRLRIQSVGDPGSHGTRLHAALVELVDDRLFTEHGIDRFEQPERARRVIGDDLMRFVSSPPSPRELADQRTLEHIVSLVERIPAEAP
jgi:hypothetical protein